GTSLLVPVGHVVAGDHHAPFSPRPRAAEDTTRPTFPPVPAATRRRMAARGGYEAAAAGLAGWRHGTCAWNRRIFPSGSRPGGAERVVSRLPGAGCRRERAVAAGNRADGVRDVRVRDRLLRVPRPAEHAQLPGPRPGCDARAIAGQGSGRDERD